MLEGMFVRAVVAHVFDRDNFDIDEVIGVQNIRLQDPVALGVLAAQRLGQEFATLAREAAVVVGRRNFGYGHPHVQSTTALRQNGVVGIIADSFTPAFWRGSMSAGFMLVACPGIGDATRVKDTLEIDWAASQVRIGRSSKTLTFHPHTDFEQRLQRAGGIVALLADEQNRMSAPAGQHHNV